MTWTLFCPSVTALFKDKNEILQSILSSDRQKSKQKRNKDQQNSDTKDTYSITYLLVMSEDF